ncbi:hypothetical protein F5I97DRAFT_693909 [Phlebopus sp. FC_14]|nr:hypothetical protein F5I97DRAFT_693909 [Phlebopus sp. FC_14]
MYCLAKASSCKGLAYSTSMGMEEGLDHRQRVFTQHSRAMTWVYEWLGLAACVLLFHSAVGRGGTFIEKVSEMVSAPRRCNLCHGSDFQTAQRWRTTSVVSCPTTNTNDVESMEMKGDFPEGNRQLWKVLSTRSLTLGPCTKHILSWLQNPHTRTLCTDDDRLFALDLLPCFAASPLPLVLVYEVAIFQPNAVECRV